MSVSPNNIHNLPMQLFNDVPLNTKHRAAERRWGKNIKNSDSKETCV